MNVVLVAPEIPQNTGNIGRLCVSTGSKLHLIKPLGFRLPLHLHMEFVFYHNLRHIDSSAISEVV